MMTPSSILHQSNATRFALPFYGLSLVCTKGYENVLCGSCSDGYGQYKLSCVKCKSIGFIIFYIIATFVYMLIAYWAAVSGVLDDSENGHLKPMLTRLNHLSRYAVSSMPSIERRTIIPSCSFTNPQETPINPALHSLLEKD